MESKQELLLNEILNKGYCPKEFEAFVAEQQPERSDDLEKWTYDELKNIVLDFQNQPPSGQLNSTVEIIQPPQTSAPCYIPLQPQVKLANNLYIDPYYREIPCNKAVLKIPANLTLDFQIFDPVEIKGGLLSLWGSRVVFPIHTNDQMKVSRSLKDFMDLRRYLVSDFPEILIPVIPYEQFVNKDHILAKKEKIKCKLAEFLQVFNENPIMRHCDYVIKFLSENQEKLLRQAFKFQPQRITSLAWKYSATGKIRVELSAEQTQTAQQMSAFINSHFNLFQSFQEELNNFRRSVQNALVNLRSIQAIVSDVVRLLPNSEAMQQFGKVFYLISHLTGGLSKSIENQVEVMVKNIDMSLLQCQGQSLAELDARYRGCLEQLGKQVGSNQRNESDKNNVGQGGRATPEGDGQDAQDMLDIAVYMQQSYCKQVNQCFNRLARQLGGQLRGLLEGSKQISEENVKADNMDQMAKLQAQSVEFEFLQHL